MLTADIIRVIGELVLVTLSRQGNEYAKRRPAFSPATCPVPTTFAVYTDLSDLQGSRNAPPPLSIG